MVISDYFRQSSLYLNLRKIWFIILSICQINMGEEFVYMALPFKMVAFNP